MGDFFPLILRRSDVRARFQQTLLAIGAIRLHAARRRLTTLRQFGFRDGWLTGATLTLHSGQRSCNQDLISCRKGSFSSALYARHSGLVIKLELGGSATGTNILSLFVRSFV